MRIGLVNDLQLAIKVLERALEGKPGYEIAWVAENGLQALQKCKSDPPDIVLMDLIMPVMNGVEATRRIMQESPCPILVVTSSVGENASLVFDAMGYGALDATNTPCFGPDQELIGGQMLIRKMEIVGRLIGKASKPLFAPIQLAHPSHAADDLPPLVVIGASTGGPLAVSEILKQLSAGFAGAVIVVQHVDQDFAGGLAEWLGEHTPLSVSVVRGGEEVEAGRVYLSGTNDHLVMTQGRSLVYTRNPRDLPYRPSVDVLFKSCGKNWPTESMAVLLTGMGRDGATGMKALRDIGWKTIAQDQSSCVVYGMPKAAVEIDAVDCSMDPKSIGHLIDLFAKKESLKDG